MLVQFAVAALLARSAQARFRSSGSGRHLVGGGIAGIVIGVIALIVLCILLAFLARRRRRLRAGGGLPTVMGGTNQVGPGGPAVAGTTGGPYPPPAGNPTMAQAGPGVGGPQFPQAEPYSHTTNAPAYGPNSTGAQPEKATYAPTGRVPPPNADFAPPAGPPPAR